MAMEEVLAAIVVAEQATALATRLYQSAKASGDPTPDEIKTARDRAQAANDRLHALLSDDAGGAATEAGGGG